MDPLFIKTPRLYIDQPFQAGALISLDKQQSHYLLSVLRMKGGDNLRVFNGRDGEFLSSLRPESKKKADLFLKKCLKDQPADPPARALYFAPIKKQRMDFLIEKAVELGVSDLHPILTMHTEVRRINEERLRAQIIEAAEQCERMSLPRLHPLEDMMSALQKRGADEPLFWACERSDSPILGDIYKGKGGFLIGPEGGFAAEEISALEVMQGISAVSLGERILRAETAALYCLAISSG